jgi:hypothetical protein
MSELQMSRPPPGDFGIDASPEAGHPKVRFFGNADMKAIEAIEKCLMSLHADVQRVGATEVLVDFQDLEFMNSSCIKSFVNWVNRVRSLEEKAQYRIRFRSNPNAHWQKRSLHALSCFAADLVILT